MKRCVRERSGFGCAVVGGSHGPGADTWFSCGAPEFSCVMVSTADITDDFKTSRVIQKNNNKDGSM